VRREEEEAVDSFIGRGGRAQSVGSLIGWVFLLSPCVMNQGSEESRLKMWLLMPRKRAFFECFPYVCPEPVLVKR
jgi:hypothetical protein